MGFTAKDAKDAKDFKDRPEIISRVDRGLQA